MAEAVGRADLDAAGLPPAERALMDYVRLLTERPAQATADDAQKLRDAGWTDPQIAEAVFIAALFAFFNRVADAFGLLDPNYAAILGPPGVATRPGKPVG